MSSIVIMQARMNSERLPGKVLLPIGSTPLVVLAVKRAANTGKKVIVATSDEVTDRVLCYELKKNNIEYFQGSLHNVLQRFTYCLKNFDDDTLVFRLTADNVFPDGSLLDELEKEFVKTNVEYLVCNGVSSGLPYGVSVELTRLKYLREAEKKATLDIDLEHVTTYIRRKYGECYYERYKNLNLGSYRATIDTFEDYISVTNIFKYFDYPFEVSWKKLSKKLKEVDIYRITKGPVDRLVLGSAQFGLDYGINNTDGKPNLKNVSDIVRKAAFNGVEYIDTAREYGESELILGKVLNSSLRSSSKIITKLSALKDCQESEKQKVVESFVKESVFESCVRLKRSPLDCLMLHRFEHLHQWNGRVLKTLVTLQKQGYIDHLGVSVQNPDELISALDYYEIEFIQMPFNILDGRWNKAIDKIIKTKESRNLIVHTRSALLQGLLVSKDKYLWNRANTINSDDIISWLGSLSIKHSRNSIIDLCFAYVRSQSWIDGIVVGMETIEQLDHNLKLFESSFLTNQQIQSINISRPKLSERVLDPSHWSK